MATFNGLFSIANTAGTQSVKIKYRLTGTSAWTAYNIASSGTTFSITGTNNLLYDFQVTNVNNAANPSSAITQSIWLTAPVVNISPANASAGYSFANLSYDIDTYTCSIAQFSTPGSIIATHILPAGAYPGTLTDTFSGLLPLTEYILSITPAANQFFQTFTYLFTTTEVSACAAPTGATAALT